MNVTLLGYGRWGEVLAENLARSDCMRLRQIFTFSKQESDAARTRHPDLEILISDRGIAWSSIKGPLVYIALPNFMHRDVATRLLALGHRVVSEKPFLLSWEDLAWYQSLSAHERDRIIVAHRFRVHTLWRAFGDLIRKYASNDMESVEFKLNRPPFRPGVNRWRYDETKVGSWILEEFVHYVDLLYAYTDVEDDPSRLRVSGVKSESGKMNSDFSFDCQMGGVPVKGAMNLNHNSTLKEFKICTSRYELILHWSWSKQRRGEIQVRERGSGKVVEYWDQDEINNDRVNNLHALFEGFSEPEAHPESLIRTTRFCLLLEEKLCAF